MQSSDFSIKILGTRGSMAVSGKEYDIFGGATSCYLVQAGDETVFLDAGSGLTKAPVDFPNTPYILISHLHLDHIMGLGMYPRLSRAGAKTRICMPAKTDEEAVSILNGLYSPPYWPVNFGQYAGDVKVEPLSLPIRLNDLLIEGIPGRHPGGCIVFKLSFKGRSLVYLTDFEHEEAFSDELVSFAQNADLILYDGQYTADEYEKKRGFGHSTPDKGLELKKRCNVKRLYFVHHDPLSTDDVLLERESVLDDPSVRYARQGEEIYL